MTESTASMLPIEVSPRSFSFVQIEIMCSLVNKLSRNFDGAPNEKKSETSSGEHFSLPSVHALCLLHEFRHLGF